MPIVRNSYTINNHIIVNLMLYLNYTHTVSHVNGKYLAINHMYKKFTMSNYLSGVNVVSPLECVNKILENG